MHNYVLVPKAKFECSEEILQILSMLQIQNVFVCSPNHRISAVRSNILIF